MDTYRFRYFVSKQGIFEIFLVHLFFIFGSDLGISQNGCLDTVFEIQGHQVYLAVNRSDIRDNKRLPVLMAIHGSGRNAKSYRPKSEYGVPFYIYQRDVALQNGCLFVVVSNGEETWGTDKGLKNLLRVYRYVSIHFSVEKKWILWGTSAGGILMFRMIKNHPELVRKALGTFPVYDLREAYEKRKNRNFVWRDSIDFVNINPARFPDQLISIPILIFHGENDDVVPAENHSLRLKKEVNALGGEIEVVIVSGGHSIDNWKMYNDDKIDQFINN